MINEPTATVRKQLLHSMDSILEAYPNCYPVLWAWCKVITPMMRDADAKNIELAMEVVYLLNCFLFITVVNGYCLL